jgi:hypothetical protein
MNGKEKEKDITPLFFFLMLVVYLLLDNSKYNYIIVPPQMNFVNCIFSCAKVCKSF